MDRIIHKATSHVGFCSRRQGRPGMAPIRITATTRSSRGAPVGGYSVIGSKSTIISHAKWGEAPQEKEDFPTKKKCRAR